MADAPAPAPATPAPGRAQWLIPWVIVGLGLLILLPGNHLLPLIDRDEPRFAQAALDMRASGDWVVPMFNGQFRFDKPPLTYWLMIPCYAVFGDNEFAARLPSVLAAVLAALVLWRFGRRLGGDRLGLAAAGLWLTLAQVLIHGRAAVADMPMVLAVLVAQWAVYELLCVPREQEPYPWRWYWTLYGALGLGFLAKGPIAWAVPALALLLLRWVFWRQPLPWGRLRLFTGSLVVLAIIAPWGIAALMKTHGAYWQQGMQHHVVERGLGAFDHRSFFFFFYFATAFFSLFPWIALAGDGLALVRRAWRRDQAFLLAWLIAPYVIFTPYATQLPHYVMPGFPAFCLLIGQVLVQGPAVPRPTWARVWFWGIVGVVLAAAVLLAGLTLWPWPAPFDALRHAALGAAGVLAGLALLPVAWRLNRGLWLVPLLLVTIGCLGAVAANLRQLSPAVQLRTQFARLPVGAKCLFQDFTEPSIIFYSHRHWRDPGDLGPAPNAESVAANVAAFLRTGGPHVLVAEVTELRIDRALKWLWQHPRADAIPIFTADHRDDLARLPLEGYVRYEVSGLNLAHSSWVTVVICVRPGDTPVP